MPRASATGHDPGIQLGRAADAVHRRAASAHGRWLMYQRARGGGAVRRLPGALAAARRVRGEPSLRAVARRDGPPRGVRGYFNLYEVPREELAEFDLPERGDIFRRGGCPSTRSGTDSARSAFPGEGGTGGHPRPSISRPPASRSASAAEDWCSSTRRISTRSLHREGTSGAGVRARLDRYDAWMGEAFAAADARGQAAVDLPALGPRHGGRDAPRRGHGPAANSGAPAGHDYLAFFDSTMARFWWRTSRARDAVHAALGLRPAAAGCGRGRTGAPRLPLRGSRYGEDIYLLGPGG